MTRKEAQDLYASEFWEDLSFHERAKFQLFEDRLCMPFDIYHEAVEKCLDRPVFTHEFGLNVDGLQKEFLGDNPKPSFNDILNLIPKDKRVLVVTV